MKRDVLRKPGVRVLLIAVVISLLVGLVEWKKLREPWSGITGGLIASGILVTTTYLFDLIVNSDRRRMRLFFGEELVKGRTMLVYPDFELENNAEAPVADGGRSHVRRPVNPRSSVPCEYSTHFKFALSLEDTLALNHLSEVLPTSSTERHLLVDDREALHHYANRSFVSFGLGSNDVTRYLYCERLGLASMFRTERCGTFERIIVHQNLAAVSTNEVKSKKLRPIVHENWGEQRAFPHASEDEHTVYGLIVRHTPAPVLQPTRRWFICGGTRGEGTLLAGFFLSRHWNVLRQLVNNDKDDFIAIVSCPPGGVKCASLCFLAHKPPLDGNDVRNRAGAGLSSGTTSVLVPPTSR
jgi:hypothetical protein